MLLRERNPEQEGDAMGGKKDIPRTVRLDEDLDAWAQSSAAECECSFSDLGVHPKFPNFVHTSVCVMLHVK